MGDAVEGAPRRGGGEAATVREAGPADLPTVVAIANEVFPDFAETVEEVSEFDIRLRDGGYDSLRLVAERGGEIVGVAHVYQPPGTADRSRYRGGMSVPSRYRRRGIGGALYDRVREALGARGAGVLESFASEAMPESVAFLLHRGFLETMHTWEFRLDVGGFDPGRWAPHLERVRRAGVTIATLAEERRRDPEAVRRAYELHNAVVADIPATSLFAPPSFEHFVRSQLDSPRALPEAYFVARIGEAYVAEANLHRPQAGRALVHNVTGVLPAYRGRGIAMALKLATIAYAQAQGYGEIRTWNEQYNAGMIAINERLGFVRQPAWITFERLLTAGGA